MLTFRPHPDADMTEETPSPDGRGIPISKADADALFVALQWPEDRETALRLVTPTNLREIGL